LPFGFVPGEFLFHANNCIYVYLVRQVFSPPQTAHKMRLRSGLNSVGHRISARRTQYANCSSVMPKASAAFCSVALGFQLIVFISQIISIL